MIIADAPCHGKKYHTLNDDKYPDGCPKKIDIEDLILKIGKKEIDLNVVDITDQTTQMYEIFQKIYSKARG